MSHILNFRNWYRLNEQAENLTGSTSEDIAALDSIQELADVGFTFTPKTSQTDDQGNWINPPKPSGPETLTTMVGTTTGSATGLGLATGQPYKVMTFNLNTVTNGVDKVHKAKVIFFAEAGTLRATVYRDNVMKISGEVWISKPSGQDFWQFRGIGEHVAPRLVPESGVEIDFQGFSAPVAQGVASVLSVAEGRGEGAKLGYTASLVSRGKSNVKYSSDHSLLTDFIAAERAKAAPTQKP